MTQQNGSRSGKDHAQTTGAGIKETLESILVAFILAFVFRAFVVEAFVIPTGSMAPTLLGAHIRFTCADCGYRFDVNYGATQVGEDLLIPKFGGQNPQTGVITPRDFPAQCPNCGFRMRPEDIANPDASATNPPVHYGDRILVLKYLYLFQEPRRWDVVVFKSPAATRFDVNFIKRLVGKPGETVLILDGDVYVAKNPKSLDDFRIQTKPDDAQEALWRIVYDNDYYPGRLSSDSGHRWEQPWTVAGGKGWDLGNGPANGRVFHFDNDAGEGSVRFTADANPSKYALTDWLAYNLASDQHHSDRFHWVSDLKLELFYERRSGEGPLKLHLTKQGRTFTAVIEPTQARLLDQGNTVGDAVPLRPDTSAPLHIEFMNVDHQVTLRLNGRTAIRKSYKPNLAKLLAAYRNESRQDPPEVRITARRQVCALSHVSLWRDVYYLNRDDGDRPLAWGGPDTLPESMQSLPALGPGEYFVLGDNSAISGDARFWTKPIDLPDEDLQVQSGRVPERFMLGKAFFVYWPAGYRPLSSRAPGIVPNFGDMRFIH